MIALKVNENCHCSLFNLTINNNNNLTIAKLNIAKYNLNIIQRQNRTPTQIMAATKYKNRTK